MNTIIINTVQLDNNIQISIPASISSDDISTLITRISKSIQTEEVLPAEQEQVLFNCLDGHLDGHLNGIKAVVFDIYGTLIHSAAGDINIDSCRENTYFCVNELGLKISHQNINTLLKAYILMKHTEMRNTQSIQYPEIDAIQMWKNISKDKAFPLDELTDTQAALCAVSYEIYNNPSCEMPFAMSVLESLHNKGVMLGIVSNAQFYTPLFLQAIFQKYPLWNALRFPVQVWSYQMKEAKPSSQLFQRMLDEYAQLNIHAHEIVYIGNDKRNDIAPPQSLGIRTLLFAGDSLSYRPRRDDPTINAIHPDAIITTLEEILLLI